MIDPVTLMTYPKTRDEFLERFRRIAGVRPEDCFQFAFNSCDKREILLRSASLATRVTVEIWELDGKTLFRNEY